MQEISLNQNTFSLFPSVYAVQNDTGRELKMTLTDRTLVATDTAAVAVNRSDGSYYTITGTVDTATNSVTADITQALTQPGRTLCQLKITDTNDLVVSSYTFCIMVQASTDGLNVVEQEGYSVQDLMAAVQTIISNGISPELKAALLQIAAKVAYIDENGQDYYDALDLALNPPVDLVSISAVFDQTGVTIYETNTLDDLKPYLTVTATYSDSSTEIVTTYTLTGSLTVGTSTITVSYGGKTATFTVTVSAPQLVTPWYNASTPYALGNYSGDNTDGLYPNSGTGQNARHTICYDTGAHKYKAKSSNTSDSFKNKTEVDFYPIPIPSGATSASVMFPSAYAIIPNVLHYDDTLACYVRDIEMTPWTSALTSHTIDVSSYNDGTKYLALNIKAQLADATGCSISFT